MDTEADAKLVELVEVVSPLNGTVVGIERGVGHCIDPDSAVVTVETGDMRVAVEAGVAGIVEEVRAYVGGIVEPGSVLVVVAAHANSLSDPAADEVADEEEADGALRSPPALCTHCRGGQLEAGFIEDSGQYSSGFGRWVQGPLEIGLFGPRRMGRRRRAIEAYRCLRCSHLEFFTTEDM